MKSLFGIAAAGIVLGFAASAIASPLATSANETPLAGGFVINPWLAAQPLDGRLPSATPNAELHPLLLTNPDASVETALHFSSATTSATVSESVEISERLDRAFDTSEWSPDVAPGMVSTSAIPTRKH